MMFYFRKNGQKGDRNDREILVQEEEEEDRDSESKNPLEKKTATACCSIFGRLADCLLKYCPVAVGLERGTEWQ